MVLRSLFLGSSNEVNWLLRWTENFKPELIQELNLILGNNIFDNPIKKLGKMLESKNLKKVCIAAELWQREQNLFIKKILNLILIKF